MNISIIITCYNLERYIGHAIESVLAQDYAGNLEIIVVDDCSTDASAEIIGCYKGLSYVRMPENSGVLMATVAGIEMARGDLIFFLDGDDIWVPEKISAVLAHISEDQEIALITHDLIYIDQSGNNLEKISIPGQVMVDVERSKQSAVIRDGILMQRDFVWLGSALAVRKSKCMMNEFCSWAKSLPDAKNTYQDWTLAFWVAALPQVRMAYIPGKLFKYRLHGANYSGDASTPERAIRNVLRTRNTVAAMFDIATRMQLESRVRTSVMQHVRFNEYLLVLYEGMRAKAFLGFLKCQPQLFKNPKMALKEWLRFTLVQLLGIRVFLILRRSYGQ